jgi:glycosyltransferase involved in cell wall biosynthesis
VEAITLLREQHRFMKGLFAWIGFRQVSVVYERSPRLVGKTKWSYWKLLNLSLEGITSFSMAPLRAASYIGLVAAAGAVIYSLIIIGGTIIFGNPVAGYPSLLVVMLFLGGVQLLSLGIIGEYVGRVFNETKQRPLYLIDSFLPGEPSRPSGEAAADAERTEGPTARVTRPAVTAEERQATSDH